MQNPDSILYKSCQLNLVNGDAYNWKYIYSRFIREHTLYVSINYEEFFAKAYYDFDKTNVNYLPTVDDLQFTCEEKRYKYTLDEIYSVLKVSYHMKEIDTFDDFKSVINSVITSMPDEYKERNNIDDLGPKSASKCN